MFGPYRPPIPGEKYPGRPNWAAFVGLTPWMLEKGPVARFTIWPPARVAIVEAALIGKHSFG